MGKDWFGISVAAVLISGTAATFAADYTPPSTAVSKINSYRGYSELTDAASGMDIDQYTYNMTTWQISNGGFYKAMADKYKSAYTGGQKSEWRSKDGGDLGTIDNNATIQEMRLLAVRYKETTNSNYKSTFKSSFNKALNFILTMQRSTGGLPQVWPKRGNYSDHVTLNDNAMVRAMVTMMDIANRTSPFDSDIIDDATRNKMKSALDKAVDYLLKAQIVNNGNLTVWCAQHDTANYAPRPARAYELESKSGSESAGAVWFLMNWPEQTEAIQKAVKGAITWYKKTRVVGLYFNKKAGTFEQRDGNVLWYRFYEVNNDNYFFCDRDGASTKTQDFTKISEERRTGYQWAGDYGTALLSTEAAYLTALEKMQGTYVEPPPPAAMCGSDTCKVFIDGVDFTEIKGVKEASNLGFVGEGYANVDNEKGSYVTYGVTAEKDGKYTLYISFANGGSSARGYSVTIGDKTPIADGSMESTGGWTTWKSQSVEIELEKGYNELKFESLSSDGMANIDYIGWMDTTLHAGKVDASDTTTAIGTRGVRNTPVSVSDRYFVDFGTRANRAGVYLIRNGRTFRVNGKTTR
ncbi:pectate lyase [Fibrobacter sp. UWR2]|uniref:pectate lyase n=1 Tax=Fibrobacter sp. UWR2 TaxID=1964352 RepID=UPI000B52025D|nr:pectate lyase [Fibrobacter sp. UWR2]OWV01899.1 pectate lyase [Fibrobacter sp. UWR2]